MLLCLRVLRSALILSALLPEFLRFLLHKVGRDAAADDD